MKPGFEGPGDSAGPCRPSGERRARVPYITPDRSPPGLVHRTPPAVGEDFQAMAEGRPDGLQALTHPLGAARQVDG